MNKTEATASPEFMLSKHRLTFRHNLQGHKNNTFPKDEIHLIEAESQFNVKFYLIIDIILYKIMVPNKHTSVRITPITNQRQINCLAFTVIPKLGCPLIQVRSQLHSAFKVTWSLQSAIGGDFYWMDSAEFPYVITQKHTYGI
jgi:hypothetical protein